MFSLPKLDKAMRNHLKKLKVDDVLHFIIKYPPKSYTNTTPSTALIPHTQVVLRVEIHALHLLGFGKNARLHIQASTSDFKQDIELLIFHPKIFHKKLFAPNTQHYVMGKLESYQGRLSLIQPKVITQINTITPNFASTSLKNQTIHKLACALITHSSLSILPPHIAQKIYEMFYPTPEFVSAYQAHGFSSEHINALKFVEIYRYLALLSQKKSQFPARFICANNPASFLQSLPFTLTDGQKNAISDIRRDLQSPIASRRLIMGDVGCGKSVVIFSAVMCAYPHTSILMAPTTILATQLYEEAKRLLPAYIKIHLITSKTLKMPQDIQEAHFIIGTQALLYRELALKNLALVMSDEQHRFGTKMRYTLEKVGLKHAMPESDTESRLDSSADSRLDSHVDFHADTQESEALDSKEDELDSMLAPHFLPPTLPPELLPSTPLPSTLARPHVLQFSATPIPRTLAMINAQFIHLSLIKDLPFKKDITTHIIDKSGFKSLLTHLQSEVSKGNQAIIVYPLVEESQALNYLSLSEGLGFWQRHFEGVYCTSGKDKNKQDVIDEFAIKGSLLLATTLIEVGISLPKVSTIVIVAPERLGLATLHQLRGRVSRNGLKGYCYLYTHQRESPRLQAFAQTLSGFEIAELDLQYRSSGDLLSGTRQSGSEFEFIDLSQDMQIIQEAKAFLDVSASHAKTER